jgi:hypothetical protein
MADIPTAVQTLERDLREVFGTRVQSLVVYGSHTHDAAQRDASHGHGEPPLVHTLIVVDTMRHDDLSACAARVASWHDAGLATPFILAAGEIARSLDAFPYEFSAILADHAVVSGKSPFEGLSVDSADLRRACEVQARSHLLHLRQGYVETRGRGDALAVLIVRSAAAWASLLQNVARLQGHSSLDATAAARHVEHALHLTSGVEAIAALTHAREIPSADALRLFPAYLDAAERLANYVDGWSVTK